MVYKIKIHKRVDKFLEFHWFLVNDFFKKIDILSKNPRDKTLDIKNLKWEKDKYRLRIRKYRFLYEIIDDELIIDIYDSDSRWDIYK